MGEETLKLGLLVETAQAHQQLADQSLTQLRLHAEGLDAVVRDEIRRTFVDECGALVHEAHGAADALLNLRRSASRRLACWSLVCAAVSAGAALMVLERLLPSQAQMASLRAQRSQLSAVVEQLAASGGRIDLRRCGSTQRLCVRVDRRAPAYGEAGDYFILEGY
ncbi:MAG: hypothetical protein ACREU2_14275 [Steroidobacteraceae bacterium]